MKRKCLSLGINLYFWIGMTSFLNPDMSLTPLALSIADYMITTFRNID